MTKEELEALNDRLVIANGIACDLDGLERLKADIEKCEPKQLLHILGNNGFWHLDDDCLNKIKETVLDWLKSREEQLIEKFNNFEL